MVNGQSNDHSVGQYAAFRRDHEDDITTDTPFNEGGVGTGMVGQIPYGENGRHSMYPEKMDGSYAPVASEGGYSSVIKDKGGTSLYAGVRDRTGDHNVQCMECKMTHGHNMDAEVIRVNTNACHTESIRNCDEVVGAIGDVLKHMRMIVKPQTGCGEYPSQKGKSVPLLLRNALNKLLSIDALKSTVRVSDPKGNTKGVLLLAQLYGTASPDVKYGCSAIEVLHGMQQQVVKHAHGLQEKRMSSLGHPRGRKDVPIECQSCLSPAIWHIPGGTIEYPPIPDGCNPFRMPGSIWSQLSMSLRVDIASDRADAGGSVFSEHEGSTM